MVLRAASPGLTIAGLHQQAATVADPLPGLMMAANRVAADVAPGCHGRRRIGQGEAFWQFRPWDNGDSIRQIDWRQSARSDHVFIRQQEWEAAQTLYIWAGRDAAMMQDKRFDRAAILALAVGMLLSRGREKIAIMAHEARPATGTIALQQLGRWLLRPVNPYQDMPPLLPLPHHGRALFLSDGWQPLDQWAEIIAWYHRRRITGHIVQLVLPDEINLGWQGSVRFTGLFGEAPETVPHVDAARAPWQERVRDHQAGLRHICQRAGWFFTRHRLDHAPATCLLQLYHQLTRPEVI